MKRIFTETQQQDTVAFQPETDRERALMEFASLQDTWEILGRHPDAAFVHTPQALTFIRNAIALRLKELGYQLAGADVPPWRPSSDSATTGGGTAK